MVETRILNDLDTRLNDALQDISKVADGLHDVIRMYGDSDRVVSGALKHLVDCYRLLIGELAVVRQSK